MAYRFRVRRFLNLIGHHAGAYIFAEVEDTTGQDDDGWPFGDAHVTLADCGRVISFEFDLNSAASRRNSLRKVDLMIGTLIQFREALQAEANLAASRGRNRPKKAR